MGVAEDIREFVTNNNVDIINCHGAKPNFIYIFLKKKIHIPGVTTMHSDYRYDFINNKVKYILFTPLNSIAIRYFDNYICVSERIKNLLEYKKLDGPKYVVHNGIDTNIRIFKSRKEIRERYNIGNDTFLYTMVARMHPIKNHAGALRALARLKEEFKDVGLMMVGDGEYEDSVRHMAMDLGLNDYVCFAGYQDKPIDYINAGDINILTSFNETFPIVILEGAMVKKAAICSDVGDVGNIITGDTGFLVDPNSVDDIYSKMRDAYMRKAELSDMGYNIYHKVTENYSVDKFCRKYYDAYKSILGGKNG